jgi:hypothetical protein
MQLVEASVRQGIMVTWNPETVHFLPIGYETMNDMLLNDYCGASDES